MDRLSRLRQEERVKLTSEGGNTLDSVVDELKDIGRELLLQRKGQEEFIYGEEIEDTDLETVDLDDVPEKEVDNG